MAEIKFEMPARPEGSGSSDRKRFPLPVADDESGAEYWIYYPTAEQAAMFSRVNSRVASDEDKLYGVFEFLQAITDPVSFGYIRARYIDPDDPFETEQLIDLLEAVTASFAEDAAANRAERRALSKKE